MARQFRDAAGVEWTVFVTHPSTRPQRRVQVLAEAYREGWLVFESAAEKRRLAPVPAGWDELSDEGLAALCAAAEPQPPRARPTTRHAADVAAPAQTAGGGESREPGRPLRGELDEVTSRLGAALAQVCGERADDVSAQRLDTGELIRVEETLVMAAEMAKEAVTLRRKLRAPHRDREENDEQRPR